MVDARRLVFFGATTLVGARYLVDCLLRPRPLPPECADRGDDAKVTAVVVAFNEEASITRTLASLTQASPEMSLVVADDGSTDRTVEVCRRFAGQSHLLTVLNGRHEGKMPRLRAALNLVTTEFVVTVDADTVVNPVSLRSLASRMIAEDLSACSGNMHVEARSGFLTSMQALEFALLNADRQALSRRSCVSVLPGAFTMWRTSDLRGLTADAVNDIDLTFEALLADRRIGFDPKARCRTSVPDRWFEVLNQRRRWAHRKINRTPWILRTIFGRDVPARARLAEAHLFVVHIVISLSGWWIDVWALYALVGALCRGWSLERVLVLASYSGVLVLGAALLRQSDCDTRNPIMWLCAGPWERLTRGLAAWSVILWPRRNVAGWTPRRGKEPIHGLAAVSVGSNCESFASPSRI